MGQVYAVNDVKASCVMNLVVALSSPLLFILSNLGAVIGCILPLFFLPSEDFPLINDGIYGYNALLAMAAAEGKGPSNEERGKQARLTPGR